MSKKEERRILENERLSGFIKCSEPMGISI